MDLKKEIIELEKKNNFLKKYLTKINMIKDKLYSLLPTSPIVAIDGDYATLRLKSGETRKIFKSCRATIGEVGNSEYNLQKHGKAGAKRWLGVRPTVRGVAMNPIDHPHGGGEGKTSGGRHPVSPTGQSAKGLKTRDNKRTDKYIVKRRNKRKDTK